MVVVGPSGVGKGTVIAAVLAAHPEVWLSVSATTRAPRPGEVEGESYFFLLRAEFERRIAAAEMLEYAEYSGNLYGTPRAPVQQRLDDGVHVLLEIELQGARQVRQSMPDALFVFLAPPSWEELEHRLRSRGTETDEALELRLETARVEMQAQGEFDNVIINRAVGEAAAQLVGLMQSPKKNLRAGLCPAPTQHPRASPTLRSTASLSAPIPNTAW